MTTVNSKTKSNLSSYSLLSDDKNNNIENSASVVQQNDSKSQTKKGNSKNFVVNEDVDIFTDMTINDYIKKYSRDENVEKNLNGLSDALKNKLKRIGNIKFSKFVAEYMDFSELTGEAVSLISFKILKSKKDPNKKYCRFTFLYYSGKYNSPIVISTQNGSKEIVSVAEMWQDEINKTHDCAAIGQKLHIKRLINKPTQKSTSSFYFEETHLNIPEEGEFFGAIFNINSKEELGSADIIKNNLHTELDYKRTTSSKSF